MGDEVDISQDNTQLTEIQIKGSWQLGQKSALKHHNRTINYNMISSDVSTSSPPPVKQFYNRDSSDTVLNTYNSQISSPIVIKQKSSLSQHFSPYKLPPLYLSSRLTPIKRRTQTLPDEDINQPSQNEQITPDQFKQNEQIRIISRTSDVVLKNYNSNDVSNENNRNNLKVISQSINTRDNIQTRISRAYSNLQYEKVYNSQQNGTKKLINRSQIIVTQNPSKSRQTSRHRLRCISQDSSNSFLTAQDKQAQIKHITQVSRTDEQLCQVVQNNLSVALQSKSTSVEQKMDKVKVETKKMEDIAKREQQLLQVQPENNNVRQLISHIYLETISAKIAVLIQAMERNKMMKQRIGRIGESREMEEKQNIEQQLYESPKKQQRSQHRLVSFNVKDNNYTKDKQFEDKPILLMNSYNYNHIQKRSPFKK